MDLDKSYFNSIRLDTIRKKYYDADTVDRLLVDIRSKADMMNREFIEMKACLTEAEKSVETLREENEDLRYKGKMLSQEILSLREDLKDAQRMEAGDVRKNLSIECFEALLTEEKELHRKAIARLNERWQELLQSIDAAPAPGDLEEKIGKIAREVQEIEEL